jgi:hypothetical protein
LSQYHSLIYPITASLSKKKIENHFGILKIELFTEKQDYLNFEMVFDANFMANVIKTIQNLERKR